MFIFVYIVNTLLISLHLYGQLFYLSLLNIQIESTSKLLGLNLRHGLEEYEFEYV